MPRRICSFVHPALQPRSWWRVMRTIFSSLSFNTLLDTPDSSGMLNQNRNSQGVKHISARFSSHLKRYRDKTWKFKPVSSNFRLNVRHCGWKKCSNHQHQHRLFHTWMKHYFDHEGWKHCVSQYRLHVFCVECWVLSAADFLKGEVGLWIEMLLSCWCIPQNMSGALQQQQLKKKRKKEIYIYIYIYTHLK